LQKFMRSNQGTLIHQKPIVRPGAHVKKGDVLADGSATNKGEMALGKNLLVAFMSWEGYNFEDAVILSKRLVKDDELSSIHIEEYEIDARTTKLGDEEITRDIPNRSEESLRNLDDRGIVRIGAEVGSGDLLVGKVTPKGETELTDEEKLIRAIFKEKAREVRDTSLKVPHGEGGVGVEVMNGNALRVINAPKPTPVATPVFDGATVEDVDDALASWAQSEDAGKIRLAVDGKAAPGRRVSGKVRLFNGRTGEPFEQ